MGVNGKMIIREALSDAGGGGKGEEFGLGRRLRGGWDVRGLGNAGSSSMAV